MKRKLPSKTGNISDKDVLGDEKPKTAQPEAANTPVMDAAVPPPVDDKPKAKTPNGETPAADAFAPPTTSREGSKVDVTEDAPKMPPKARRGELQVDDLPKGEAFRKKEVKVAPPVVEDSVDEVAEPSPANFSSLDPAAPAGSAAAAQQGFGENDWVDLDDVAPPKPVTPAVAATPEAPEEPAVEEANKPWQSQTKADEVEDAWELGDLVQLPDEPKSQPSVSPIPDMPRKAETAPVAPKSARGESPFDPVKPVDSPKLPPWKQRTENKPGTNSNGGQRRTPPTLPTIAKSGNLFGSIVSLLVVGLVVVLGVMFFQNRDKAIEMVARWTGTLNKVSQELPDNQKRADALEVEAEVPHQVLENGVELKVDGSSGSTVKVDIVEDETGAAQVHVEQMPSEQEPVDDQLSDFERLQKALDRQRAKQRQDTSAKLEEESPDLDPATLTEEERMQRNLELIGSVNEELNAYRKALSDTGNPALKPKPGQFFREREGQKTDTTPQPAPTPVAPPTSGSRGVVGAAPQPQQEIPEELDDGIRKLADFVDALPEVDTSRVRVPRGLTPRISGGDFPPLEVLSLIPNYGLVGVIRGREGVLMLGETLENWELVAVYDGYAEFRLGSRNKIVTINDANR